MSALKAVSLFSNCGAGDVGYRAAGFRFEVLAELDPDRLKVAQLNHPRSTGVVGDLRATLPEVLGAWSRRNGGERPALLAACPPCQGMSTARSGRGKEHDADAGSRDPRNLLVQVVADAARELRPRVLVLENVVAFLTRKVHHPETREPVSAAVLLLDELRSDYECFPFVTNLADYGVPQTRKRCFLTFVRRGEPALDLLNQRQSVPYPQATHAETPVTIRAALHAFRLPPLDAAPHGRSQAPGQPMHAVPVWSRERYRMVEAIPPNSGATAWQTNSCSRCGPTDADADDATCSECGAALLRPVVEEGGTLRLVSGFRRSSYARMHPDEPAATITTASGRIGSDNTLHPWENRVLSILECQLLQTIPAAFRWGDALQAKGHTNVRQMIGEAVPPLFTRQHGRILSSLLAGRRPHHLAAVSDARVMAAARLVARARTQPASTVDSSFTEPDARSCRREAVPLTKKRR